MRQAHAWTGENSATRSLTDLDRRDSSCNRQEQVWRCWFAERQAELPRRNRQPAQLVCLVPSAVSPRHVMSAHETDAQRFTLNKIVRKQSTQPRHIRYFFGSIWAHEPPPPSLYHAFELTPRLLPQHCIHIKQSYAAQARKHTVEGMLLNNPYLVSWGALCGGRLMMCTRACARFCVRRCAHTVHRTFGNLVFTESLPSSKYPLS